MHWRLLVGAFNCRVRFTGHTCAVQGPHTPAGCDMHWFWLGPALTIDLDNVTDPVDSGARNLVFWVWFAGDSIGETQWKLPFEGVESPTQ